MEPVEIKVDYQNKIRALEQENESLKQKISLMYSNWQYDYNRFTELKEKYKLTK
jgi:hypothetical protein